jgi:hypothetical protein
MPLMEKLTTIIPRIKLAMLVGAKSTQFSIKNRILLGLERAELRAGAPNGEDPEKWLDGVTAKYCKRYENSTEDTANYIAGHYRKYAEKHLPKEEVEDYLMDEMSKIEDKTGLLFSFDLEGGVLNGKQKQQEKTY